jgi:hypothetical protein
MPGFRLFVAIILTTLWIEVSPSPALAIPLQHLQESKGDSEAVGSAGRIELIARAQTAAFHTAATLVIFRNEEIFGSDPCAGQEGWLALERNGVLICGSIADFYAPAIVTGQTAAITGSNAGSVFALFLLGLAALGFATRRPVWITRLIR